MSRIAGPEQNAEARKRGASTADLAYSHLNQVWGEARVRLGRGVDDLEGVLADTVLGEFKTRLGRIGLEYQSPSVPA